MPTQIIRTGTRITVNKENGQVVRGSVFSYVRGPSERAILYHVKLDKGGTAVVWPEQVTVLSEK